MKILVIGVPRSGTTSLIKAVSEKYVSEPFYNRIDNADNAIGIIKEHIRLGNNIKFTVEQYPKDCTSDIKRARFWKRLVALFDKTLLIDRYDFDDHLIAYARLKYCNENGLEIMVPYQDKDYTTSPEIHTKELIDLKNMLTKVSKSTNVPIISYEALFYGDTKKEFLDLGLEYTSQAASQLNPAGRLRNGKKSIL
jgi:hypothetical protein|tara:strand:+ start:6287 stop:6871 length:585 start_codon:yes stop_codon:yes gene_type:complete